jgi:hypothetical protein
MTEGEASRGEAEKTGGREEKGEYSQTRLSSMQRFFNLKSKILGQSRQTIHEICGLGFC